MKLAFSAFRSYCERFTILKLETMTSDYPVVVVGIRFSKTGCFRGSAALNLGIPLMTVSGRPAKWASYIDLDTVNNNLKTF